MLVAVYTFGILTQGALHACGVSQHHLVDGAARALDDDDLPADWIGRAGHDRGGGDSGGQRIEEPGVCGVDAVQGAQSRAVGIGRLVEVVAGPALGLLVDAEVGVGFDEPGQHPRAVGVDRLDVVRDRDGGGGATAVIRPSRIRTVPPLMGGPSIGTT